MLQHTGDRSLVPREDRLRVMLPARMRSASGWSDACILNVSSKGLLVYSGGAAQPGTFVEIRRGRQLVIARVVWRKNQRIGLCSADRVRVLEIINDETVAAAVSTTQRQVERRRIPRTEDRSRARARAIEFLSTVLIATALAGLVIFYVHDVLAKPLSTVKSALGAQ